MLVALRRLAQARPEREPRHHARREVKEERYLLEAEHHEWHRFAGDNESHRDGEGEEQRSERCEQHDHATGGSAHH
jgi:hypothetical protein